VRSYPNSSPLFPVQGRRCVLAAVISVGEDKLPCRRTSQASRVSDPLERGTWSLRGACGLDRIRPNRVYDVAVVQPAGISTKSVPKTPSEICLPKPANPRFPRFSYSFGLSAVTTRIAVLDHRHLGRRHDGILKFMSGCSHAKCRTISYELLMKSYCLSVISPSRTHNRSDRSPGCRLCYVSERYMPRIGYLKERGRTQRYVLSSDNT
jgi:hypothetical protein